jgi:DNA mismatch endonuclease (patch repair protein)
MADHLSPEQRSLNMARIGSRDTAPEMTVRKLLHSRGFRYRLHDAKLPGKPDVVFPGRRKAVFVHGCYWHRHRGCRYAFTPVTRPDFWLRKFAANVERDARVIGELRCRGWQVLVVWSCETRDQAALASKLTDFLDGAAAC